MSTIKFLPTTILILFLFIATSLKNPPSQSSAGNKFDFRRGTNISHWLSQSNARGDSRRNFFTEKDVQYLSGLGFDHLRIPVDEEQLWKTDGQKDEEGFSLLKNALNWCKKHKLDAIVDLHILRSHHFNEKEKPLWTEPAAQERFFQCWRDLSQELINYPVEDVAYELMNEPVADDPEDWNKLVKKLVTIIRASEPKRKIVIGSNRWQSANTFDQLSVPENDKNIILSFHMYEPFLLTHHTASWTGIKDYKGPVNYPGVIVKEEDLSSLPDSLRMIIIRSNRSYTIDSIRKHFIKPILVAKKYKLPLYCGEWGCLNTVPDEARLQWYKDMKTVLEENKIGWATWDYKGGFGIINSKKEEEKEIIKVLTAK